jgi:hypothetical protein
MQKANFARNVVPYDDHIVRALSDLKIGTT